MKKLPCALCVTAALITTSVFADKAHDANSSEEQKFKMMDANSDGKVTANEHAVGAKAAFTKMDANKDGKVTAAEMDSSQMDSSHGGMNKEGKPNDAHHREMTSAQKIAVIDADKDGVITAAEHAAGSREMMKTMDADRSGDLTLQECKDGHKKMMSSSEAT